MHKVNVNKVLGLAVFALQAVLAILFFFSLGSSLPDAALLAALGAVLEIVKRISWRAWRRGRLASERMHARFTWRQAAERFITICEQILS